MNFDLESVPRFLADLEARAKLRLPVQDLAAFARNTNVEQERSKMHRVIFNGKSIALEYRVFMDDLEAPDIYFFTSSEELAETVQSEMRAFAKSNGL